jgi:hypothetical protein
MCGLVGEAKVKGVSGSDPKRRGQALAELSEEAARESVRRFTDYAVKRKVLTQEQAEELRALSIAEAAPRIASLKKDMVVNDVERKPELRAEVGESVWEEVKALPPEQFLQRIEAMRAFHKSVGRGHHGPPGGPQSSQGSRPSKGRPSRGGPPPNGTSQSNAEFEAKMREQARKVLKDQGLTDAEVEAKLAEGPIWKILRPSKSRGGRESWRGNDSKPSSRRGG